MGVEAGLSPMSGSDNKEVQERAVEEKDGNKKFAIIIGGDYFGEIGEIISRNDEEGNAVIRSELNGEIIVPLVDIELAENEKDAIKKSQEMMKEDRERRSNAGLL